MAERAAQIYGIAGGEELPEYPIAKDERLESHYFLTFWRRRWLHSEMRLKATPECRAHYFDAICISHDMSPIGTLPNDLEQLARLLMVEESRLKRLCAEDYGPLYKWAPCLCDGEVRLYHPVVLESVLASVARKHDNRARNEAANRRQRLRRLRESVAGLHAELAKNDRAIDWMDEWLIGQGVERRGKDWVERAIGAWSQHIFDLRGGLKGG